MLARIMLAVVLSAFLFVLAACDNEPPLATPTPTIAPTHTPLPTPTSAPTPTPTPTPSPYASYLTEEIPPCTPPLPNSHVDPCEPDVEQYFGSYEAAARDKEFFEEVRGMHDSLRLGEGLVSHIVLRGTYLPDTVRCATGNDFRPPSYLEHEDYDYVEFSIALNCYVDVKVGAYVLGEGPPILTVLRFWYSYWEGGLADIAAEEGLTEQQYVEDLITRLESDDYLGAIEGREVVLFLGPDLNVATEVWQTISAWDVQRLKDGTPAAIHTQRDTWRRERPNLYYEHRSELEMALPAFTLAVRTVHQSRVAEHGGRTGADLDLPMLLTDANKLREYYVTVGAYDHPDGPPVKPPPAPGLDDPAPNLPADDATPAPSPTPPGGLEDPAPTPAPQDDG